MERRNTIQKELVLSAVMEMKRHVTADEVYEHIKAIHPRIGKGTVYRNLNILADEGRIRRVEIPNGADRFDFLTKPHYHMTCVMCGDVFDVDMDEVSGLEKNINNKSEIEILSYDILFKGICANCNQRRELK